MATVIPSSPASNSDYSTAAPKSLSFCRFPSTRSCTLLFVTKLRSSSLSFSLPNTEILFLAPLVGFCRRNQFPSFQLLLSKYCFLYSEAPIQMLFPCIVCALSATWLFPKNVLSGSMLFLAPESPGLTTPCGKFLWVVSGWLPITPSLDDW